MESNWTPAHQPYVEWFKSHGYVQQRQDYPDSNWGIAWSTRIGIDFTDLEFWPWTNRAGVACLEAIVGHHASGENPRLGIGTCESLADVQMVHNTIRLLNGYKQPDTDDAVDHLFERRHWEELND